MMNKVFLLTDSSSLIKNGEYEDLYVINYSFFNLKTIDYDLKKTSVPNVKAVKNLILEKIKLGYNKFICITISKRLSGFYNVFKVSFENLNIDYEIIDSKTTGSQMGLIVRYAMNLLKNNFSYDKIIFEIKKAIDNSKVYFVPTNLIDLNKSGRLNNVSTILDIFNRKHILTIEDGIFKLALNSNGMKESVVKLVNIVKKDLKSKRKFYLSLIDFSGNFISYLKKEMDVEIRKSIYFNEITPSKNMKDYSFDQLVSIAYLTDAISFN